MDLTFTPLGEFETKIFLGRQHPLAHKKSLNLKDLEGYPQVRFRQESSGIHFDEDPLEVLPDQQVIYSNDRGSVMNLLCASDSYASGLGIVNSFIKDQIVLLPLKNSPKHTLGFVTNNKQKQSAIIQAFIEEIQDSYYPTTKEKKMEFQTLNNGIKITRAWFWCLANFRSKKNVKKPLKMLFL